MTQDEVAAARSWFADDLRHIVHLRSPGVVRAFATVPREHFAGPGPWRLLSPWHLQSYWTTEDTDPRHLYHDVLVAIDEVVVADGFAFHPERPADIIIVNAGVTHLSLAWLDALAEQNGRLLVPLTVADRAGAFILITRRNGATHRYEARHVCRTGIVECVGGRNSEAQSALRAAIARSGFVAIQSLRRPPEEPDETCWLAGDGWWLPTAAPDM